MPPPRQDKIVERVYGHYKILGYYGTRAVRNIIKNVLEFVVKRSRNICAMTGLNILSIALWGEGIRRTGEGGVGCQSNVQHDANSLKRTYSHIYLFSYSLFKKCAFTLAEVLITLGIIGVVAAMTIPTLTTNYRHKALEAQFKKNYSILSQISGIIKYEYNECNVEQTEEIKKTIFEKLNASGKIKYEGGGNSNNTIPPKNYKQYTFTGVEANDNLHMNCLIGNKNYVGHWGADYLAILNDGSFIGICSHPSSAAGTLITIDVNGNKGPNKFGHDIWGFHLNKDTCAVEATFTYRNYKEDEPGYGSNRDNVSTEKKCSLTDTSDSNGFYCAYYAIMNKCPDNSGKSYWDCLP